MNLAAKILKKIPDYCTFWAHKIPQDCQSDSKFCTF